MPTRVQTVIAYAVGVVSLAVAFSMARSVWGTLVSFYFWPSAHGISGLVAHSAIAAPVGGAPFGFLFGLIIPRCTLRHATYFSASSAALLLGFVAWLGLLSGPTWWVTFLDAILFVGLFALFAAVGNRVMPSLSPRAQIIAALAFLLLAALFYFGPYFYFSYAYAPEV